MQKKSPHLPIILTILLILALCCLGICLVLFAGGAAFLSVQEDIDSNHSGILIQPMPDLTPFLTPFDTNEREPSEDEFDFGLNETMQTIQNEIIPINDPIELAQRLGGKTNIPRTFPYPNAPYKIGDSKDFWVTNVDTSEHFTVTATVQFLGDNVYFWIENGANYTETDLVDLATAFDQEIYPTTREFFGSEWSPGVDHDPRIHILYARGVGRSLAGYYSSADQLHPDAHDFSNAHEMFIINADNVFLWQDYIYGTLAHEYQHMIHWYIDRNEETWLNEGFSMLSELINGFIPSGFDQIYIRDTDIQLTDWGPDIGENSPHYGAAMLFTTYFYDRFGKELTQALAAHPKNGMDSINAVFQENQIQDPIYGNIYTAQNLFVDWAVANFLGDPHAADGRYHYSIYPDAPLASPTKTIGTCPTPLTDYDVSQFGVHYIEISCVGNYKLTFSGQFSGPLLPVDPFSGDYYFWSNMGDHSNMSLQRTFDFTNTSPPIELSYQTWYDLEKDYDYVFVSASVDGESWQILETTSCTYDNPSGNSYGCGLNGQSDGWQKEHIDLSIFAGENVIIRFDYVTDAAVNGDGMVIDDIRIDAIDFFADFEEDSGGWQGQGFVRIKNILPQVYQVSLITMGNETEVTRLVLDETNQTTINIINDSEQDKVILVVSGTTPYTRERAEYRIIIE